MFQFKTQPFAHQLREFEGHARDEYRGLLFEQRTGKTKVIIDSAALLHSEGQINALVVVAPNGVHRNWITEGVADHLPDWVERYCVAWAGDDTKRKQVALEKLFDPGHHLRIFTINIEALVTKKGFAFVKRLLNATDAMFVVDESTRIKNPQTAVTKNLLKLRDMAKYRRILNGTPTTQGPLDLYSQLMFLSDDAVPLQSYVAFRNRYAEFLPATHPMIQHIMRTTGTRWVPSIVATDDDGQPRYKNLDELNEWMYRSCTRVLRKDCGDVPEKLYKRWEVEYPEKQRKMIEKALMDLKNGYTPEPINKLTAVMLYQRMICGVMPKQLTGLGEDVPMFERPEDNPRLQAIQQIVEAYPGANIVFWARFKRDLHEIVGLLGKLSEKPIARYWGDISADEREEAKEGFQAGRYQYFVGQPGAGGVGLPLYAADIIAYHSNDFSLYHRLQSEDRAEHILKKENTLIIDLETPGTVDSKIITALRSKKDVADLITGDETGEWLK